MLALYYTTIISGMYTIITIIYLDDSGISDHIFEPQKHIHISNTKYSFKSYSIFITPHHFIFLNISGPFFQI